MEAIEKEKKINRYRLGERNGCTVGKWWTRNVEKG